MKYNLHTHSFYCGHGNGTIEEYSNYANKKGFDMLGFSEHCPFPDDFYHSTRMAYSDMPDYEHDVKKAGEDSSSTILLGYECDYFPKWKGYFQDLRQRVDYLIAATHLVLRSDGSFSTPFSPDFGKKDLSLYVDSYIETMETGLFSFMAHPDVFLLYYPWDSDAIAASKDIIQAAMELSIPLEINANGILKAESMGEKEWGYPNKKFWRLAKEYGVKAVCSTDAHQVENLDKRYDDLYSFAKELEIELLEPVFDKGKLSFRTLVQR